LPGEGGKGRETLNNFVKRARSGQLPLEDVIGSICAFEEVIYWKERVSPAWGSLLSNLFAQLESNWRGEAFNTDIRSVQLVLLKKVLKEGPDPDFKVSKGNLVIWTAALKEIRMLSGQAREFSLNWVLKRCKREEEEAEESDWPVIFHNLIYISQNGAGLLLKVFEGIYECSSKGLMDHLIFLIGQNGNLGKSWIKWITGKGCFKIDPLMFSGLLILSQDIEYFNTLNSFTFSMIKLMTEIREITMKSMDPIEYLKKVASSIGSDSETGIKGALELIKNLKNDFPELSQKFFIELYKKHPFARREMLKLAATTSSYYCSNWKDVYEIDSIIFKEHFKSKNHDILPYDMISKVIESEDQLLECTETDLRVLIEINSITLNKALLNYNKPDILLEDRIERILSLSPVSNWEDCSFGQIFVLRSQVKNDEMVPKFVELSELLLVPGGIVNENLKGALIELAIEFVIEADGIYSKKEKISIISKLIGISSSLIHFGGSYSKLLGLFDDWSLYEGSLKFLLERISKASEEFYEMSKQIPFLSVEIQNLFSKTVGRIEGEVELRESVVGVIGNLAGRVVSEPQLTKALAILLSRKYSSNRPSTSSIQMPRKPSNTQMPVTPLLNKFIELSDPNLIKLVCEWGLEYGRIEGLREEMVKSILMFYGIIELEGEDTTTAISTSKFKNVHLNEKSVNFILTILLNELQNNLTVAHKLIKNYYVLYEEDPDEFMNRWVFNMIPVLIGLTRGLISGKGAIKLHSLLSSFYKLCQKLISHKQKQDEYPMKLKELTSIVGEKLNKQIYALIPLQQEKIQTILKQELNLKKSKGSGNGGGNLGKGVTDLIFEMEKFEEILISMLRARPAGEKGWCHKIVRSTARDFKIKLEQL
jgi:hypothetical protein